MDERHILFYRPEIKAIIQRLKTYKTYASAVKAGMRDCGHGKFWVDSERRNIRAARWVGFVPAPVRLAALMKVPDDVPTLGDVSDMEDMASVA